MGASVFKPTRDAPPHTVRHSDEFDDSNKTHVGETNDLLVFLRGNEMKDLTLAALLVLFLHTCDEETTR